MPDPVGQQAAPVQNASAAPAIDIENPTEETFQSFFDRGAFAPTDEKGNTLPKEEQQRMEREAQGGQQPDAAPAQETEPKAADPKAADPATEEREYASLDEYLTEQKLERDAFLELPVTVKIDGKDTPITLKEAIDGYNLRSVSQARMQQAQEERQQFHVEQEKVRQALGTRIQQTEALFKLANDTLLGDYDRLIKSPEWAQMDAGQRSEYTLAYQTRLQQIQQSLQQAAQARQAEADEAQKARVQALPQEQAKLLQARPEWRDPAKFDAARAQIVAGARKLGFSDAELQSITDHRHLLVLDLAAKQLQLQASTPGVLKRVRAAPKMAAPTARQTRSPAQESYTNARDTYFKDPSNTDAAAAAFQRQWDAA